MKKQKNWKIFSIAYKIANSDNFVYLNVMSKSCYQDKSKEVWFYVKITQPAKMAIFEEEKPIQ